MGALLRGIKREQIRRGQVLALPGSIKAVKKFKAQLYVRLMFLIMLAPILKHTIHQILTKDEGLLTSRIWMLISDTLSRWAIHSFHGQLQTTMLHPHRRYHRVADVPWGYTRCCWEDGNLFASCHLPLLIKVQVMPGDNVEMVCSLVFDVALEVGTR